jgi:hypothetical protein
MVAKMTRLTTLALGDSVWISATVRNNASPIYVAQHLLTTVTEDAFEETDYNEVSRQGNAGYE